MADVGSIFNNNLNLQNNIVSTSAKSKHPNNILKRNNQPREIYYLINNTIIYFIFDILFNQYTIYESSSKEYIKLYYKRVKIIFNNLDINSSILDINSIINIYNFIDNLNIDDAVKKLENVTANTNSQIKTKTTPSALATTLATTQI